MVLQKCIAAGMWNQRSEWWNVPRPLCFHCAAIGDWAHLLHHEKYQFHQWGLGAGSAPGAGGMPCWVCSLQQSLAAVQSCLQLAGDEDFTDSRGWVALAGFVSRSDGGEWWCCTQQAAEICIEKCLLPQNCFKLGTDGDLGIFLSFSLRTAAADDVWTVAGAQYHRKYSLTPKAKGNLNTFMAFKDVDLFVG